MYKNLFSIFFKFSIQCLSPENQLFKNWLVLRIFLTSVPRNLCLYIIQFNKFVLTPPPHCVGGLMPMPCALSECCPRICILSASHRAAWHCSCWNHFRAYLKAYHKVRRERWGEFWGLRISNMKILDSTQVHFVPWLLLIAERTLRTFYQGCGGLPGWVGWCVLRNSKHLTVLLKWLIPSPLKN